MQNCSDYCITIFSKMAYNLSVDGKTTECKIQDNKLIFGGGTTSTSVDVIDIINVAEAENNSFKLHFINKSKSPIWRRSCMNVTGDSDVCNKLMCEIKDIMKQVSPKPRKFLVMINPVGGKQSGEKSYKDIVAPVFNLAGITTEVIVSERPKHVIDVMNSYDFSETDGIVLCGGDGTYHECIATLLRRFQNEAGIDLNDINAPIKPLPFPVAMIPTGTGNVIAGTNYETDDIETAALHIVRDMLHHMNTTRWLKGKARLLIPLYWFMFKRHREFQVEIEFNNDCKQRKKDSTPEESTSNEDAEITKNSETVKGNYIASLAFIDDITDDDFNNLGNLQDSNCTAMLLYKRSGRLALVSHFKDMKNRCPDAIVRGIYFQLSSIVDDVSDDDFQLVSRLQDTHSSIMIMYKPCGRLELMKHFKRIIQKSPDAFQFDFLHNVKFTGFKFRLVNEGQCQSSNTDGQKRFIAVDGEVVEISGTEFECKWHKGIIPFPIL
ncbi:hypothetical protein KUTeg_019234 [Tegillarca granosa]|uniref:DAGKc domain-containing protein n=1 Tax=Tegillarca granosa TaxID=220873 RepID=A0ABQ9EBX9_TEGGR|nr:hypothetical protein KUTeg_019234 [Tegillarca granosa]